jgi:hypothetical protein
MSISGIGSGTASLIGLYQRRRQDLQSLESAVQSGDIASAQQALTSYQQDGQNIESAQASSAGALGGSAQASQLSGDLAFMISSLEADPASGGQSSFGGYERSNASLSGSAGQSPRSTFMKDLNTLVQAVQSGTTAGAQSAVATLLNDSPGLAAATGHGKAKSTGFAGMIDAVEAGDIGGAQSALAALQQGQRSDASGSGDPSQSGFMTDLASLIQAVQSGDMSTAQKSLATLQSDAQTATVGPHHHHHGIAATPDTSGAASSTTGPTSPSDMLGYGSVEESESQMLAIL